MREDRSEQSKRYWAGLCDYLRRRGSQLESLEHRQSDNKHYRDFRIGIRGVAVRARQQVKDGQNVGRGLSAAFILDGRNHTEESQLLQEQQVEIEIEYGESLSWYPVESETQVNTRNMDVDVRNEADWPNQHEWLAANLKKLVEVFRPRIQELRAADWSPDEDEDETDINNEAESFIEEQVEYVTSQSKSNMPMHAYVVMLHLVSQGYSDFTEIRKVLCRESPGSYYITILDHIFRKLQGLEETWGESIPSITALVFNTDGRAPKWTCEILTGDGETQPTAKQIAELSASVVAYDKWDKVLKAFKP